MTGNELICRPQELRFRGRRLLPIGMPLRFAACSFMACLAIPAILYLVIRLTIAKYALSCPLCAAPIT